MAALWSGRFDAEPDADVFAWGASFRFDRRLFEDDVAGSLAWAEALARAGAISEADARTITAALTEILERGRVDPAWLDSGLGGRGIAPDEDVHSFVERVLVEQIGDVGKRLHTGRSRNEQVSLDLRLYLKRRILAIQHAVACVVAALADQAQRAGDGIMPAYTHLRRAQPVLAAHFLLAHAAPLQRDYARFAVAAGEADELPLGSGAIAGTNYAIDTDWLARRLGFSRVVSNSMDASGDRDFVSTFLYACATTLVHVSRLAEDLIIHSSEEFGFFELADAVATGSSLMPQKKNPDPLELVRGKSGRAIGRLAGWLATLKGLPVGYNKDLQEDKEAVFDVEETTLGSLAAARTVVATMAFNAAAAERAASGLLLATDVADHLVSKGLPFRRAHEVVGGMVRQLGREGRDFSSLAPDEWRRFSELFDTGVMNAITARASVERKRTPQSTNPDAVAHALTNTRAWVASVQGSKFNAQGWTEP